MNAQEFTELLEKPERVHKKEISELKKIAYDYPYSQPVQLLYAFRLKNSSEHLFNQQLGRTSILTNDRSVLYDIFEGEDQEFPVISPSDPAEETAPLPVAGEDIPLQEKVKEEAAEEEREEESPVVSPGIIAEKEETGEKEAEEQTEQAPDEDEAEETEKERSEEEEKDLSHLPAAERIKAILERNRRLRKEFEEKKKRNEEAPVNERVRNIREKLEAIKSGEAERVKEKQEGEAKSDTSGAPENPGKAEEGKNESLVDEEALVEEHKEQQEASPETPMIDKMIEDEVTEETVFTIDDEPEESEFSAGEETKPIEGNEAHSFSSWLKRISGQPDQDKPQAYHNPTFTQKIELLDSFVEKLPELKKKGRIIGGKASSSASAGIHMGNISSGEDGALVTETLAKVYLKQGHYDKAVKAYQILKLKYPEKSSFFADRILEIKKLINSNKKEL